MEYLKFQTNIPQTITPKFNKGVEREGKFGKQWYWGVEQNGVDKGMTVTEILNDLLEKVQPAGKIIQILKYEDGNHKFWKILDAHGTDITPEARKSPTTPVQPQSGQIPEDKLKAVREAFLGLEARVKLLEEQVESLLYPTREDGLDDKTLDEYFQTK